MWLQEIAKGIQMLWQMANRSISTMLNGCQVEEKVILNCGFEDGAIVFLGMLFILIIYFVVPRACLMHGLWNADFVRCFPPAASIIFVQYNLLGGSWRDVGSAFRVNRWWGFLHGFCLGENPHAMKFQPLFPRLVLIWAPWHELVACIDRLEIVMMSWPVKCNIFFWIKNGSPKTTCSTLTTVVCCVGV